MNKKPTVLFRLGSLDGGGAERVLINILKHYDRNKFSAEVLVHSMSGVYVESIPDDVPLHIIGKGRAYIDPPLYSLKRKYHKRRSKYLSQWSYYVYNKILKKRYDIEFAFLHDIIPYIEHSPSLVKMGWIRNDLSDPNYLTERLKKKIVHTANSELDCLFSVSREAKAGFGKIGGDLAKVKVMYNPIDVSNIRDRSNEVDYTFPTVDRINILSVGRLVPQKRYDRLIDAVGILKGKGLNFHCYILGQGILENELKEMVKEKDVTEFISFLNYESNPYPLFKAADVFVLSSDHEGLPGSVCEAMTLHKPIISTKVAGSVELLKEKELGILVEKNPEYLASAMEKLITQESLRNELHQRLQATKLPFDIETNLKNIEDSILATYHDKIKVE